MLLSAPPAGGLAGKIGTSDHSDSATAEVVPAERKFSRTMRAYTVQLLERISTCHAAWI